MGAEGPGVQAPGPFFMAQSQFGQKVTPLTQMVYVVGVVIKSLHGNQLPHH